MFCISQQSISAKNLVQEVQPALCQSQKKKLQLEQVVLQSYTTKVVYDVGATFRI